MYGIWILWPGLWYTGGSGIPKEFDTEAEARAYAEEMGFMEDAIEIRPL